MSQSQSRSSNPNQNFQRAHSKYKKHVMKHSKTTKNTKQSNGSLLMLQ